MFRLPIHAHELRPAGGADHGWHHGSERVEAHGEQTAHAHAARLRRRSSDCASLGYPSCPGFALMSEALHRSVKLSRFRVLQWDAPHVGAPRSQVLILFLDKAQIQIAERSIRYRTASKG